MRLLIATWTACLAALVIACDCKAEQNDKSDPNLLATFQIARHGALLALPVTIGGEQFQFVLDSGAAAHAFDTSLIRHLGEQLGSARVAAGGRETELPTFECPHAVVGRVPVLSDGPVLAFDMTSLREVTGEDLRGLLGLEFFRDRIVRIDFDNGVLDIFDRPLEPLAEWGVPIELLTASPQLLSISAKPIGAAENAFLTVDTGFERAIDLDSWDFRRYVRNGHIIPVDVGSVLTASGEIPKPFGRLDIFQFGPFTHRQLLVGEAKRGKVGLDYLSRFVVTIDVSGRAIYMKPGERFNDPDRIDESGLVLRRIDHQIVVTTVREQSPAMHLGIQIADVLLEIDNKLAKDWRLADLRRRLCGEGDGSKVVPLRVRRGQEEISVSLPLQNWREPTATVP